MVWRAQPERVGTNAGRDRPVGVARVEGEDAILQRSWRWRVEVRFTLGSTARRITKDGRIILLTRFRKQRNNERAEVTRARKIAQDCAKRNP